MMCEGCERGEHYLCGMQTWCECDCDGPDGCYIPFDDEAVEQPLAGDVAKCPRCQKSYLEEWPNCPHCLYVRPRA